METRSDEGEIFTSLSNWVCSWVILANPDEKGWLEPVTNRAKHDDQHSGNIETEDFETCKLVL